jgi:hypothetical protein
MRTDEHIPCQDSPPSLNGFGFLSNYGFYENQSKTWDGKGITVIHGNPSNNEGTACVFSLGGGTTVGHRRDEFAVALSELIEADLIFELGQAQNQTRYKLIQS